MSSEIIKVPDIGGDTDVEIIEIAVSEGDVIEAEDTLITLESDKASMDVPAPKGGKVIKVLVKEGDKVSEGDDIVELEVEGGGESDAEPEAEADEASTSDEAPAKQQEDAAPAPKKAGGGKQTVDIKVPDLGGSDNVEIIEVAVSEGDDVNAEDPLITLESDKASMDVPSPHSGKIVSLTVKEGDTVSEGDVIGQMEIAGEDDDTDDADAPEQADESASANQSADAEDDAADDDSGCGEPERKEIRVPDLSGSSDVPIIEIGVAAGDEVDVEAPLITLESDKASMDVPSPFKGKILELTVKEGDTVSEGDVIGYMEVAGAKKAAPKKAAPEKADSKPQSAPSAKQASPAGSPSPEAQMASHKPRDGKLVHAGPAVRMLARELGVDLGLVKPSGPKDRVLKEDVQAYVKQAMANQGKAQAAAPAASGGAGIPAMPDVDFSQFGEVEEKPMGRLLKMGATNLHRSWLNVPHVTQFDEADITELEDFRKAMKAEAEAQGAKLTPLPFLVKACAFALRKFPQFNVSLKGDGDTLVWKKYVHIGIAVDTPDGLMVPVLRDADKKSLIEIAKEMAELGKKAQSKKLKREEMTGGCFTISSLGSIGGTAFTPIVNAPEVAILGVSKAQMKPVWDGNAFQPRLMMPLSLSYDHRAINGADAARFTAFLADVLTDIRRLLL
ncbi:MULTISPECIES: pyruvate dehydrogenase complex dihydrolipoyllysine-residue acetyltransferase [unclassified Halomonas]|uniref:pyruvate dehydrogenase complex dihydrolipoyllysine-residue acetyltransferase n=1 Tax=unclassified Halomonas TaxID=2609666 RepID=UPI001EF47F6B|nr:MULTISPECIES: pyruvate dehydrogenase complex dihydrolipoyllysine-residue acetyltransferase [unclassified Halomonas]MCG7575993.1 pyruvate dehydrogenase complex dihydrolipoyllysine-residue acetyltransferase [Halomonas sp. MMH1-48]MCG7603228.1 pyruvate dehydrogenase complex dihydrolipoyllysine-residue acetyltransferase [Halomonas sp. MM17-34]MCG7612478.1 pyruvate dehydrogenase complex dihydrolipoyllysine-residue acetyltransferase [Halomonas sp. MM17-29]MCG7619359.1 pyruvate dehydrogenase comple